VSHATFSGLRSAFRLHAHAAHTITRMKPQEIAELVEEKLGPGSSVAVAHETATSFELRIQKGGRTYLRSLVGESPETFDPSVVERIVASVPR
jgi:hypothetical protein